MRIVVISEWFSEEMGYAENCLSKAMASLGHEVHLITSNVQPYFNSSDYKETYEPFIGPGIVACGVKPIDGYTLHRLPHTMHRNQLHIRGLFQKLRELRPEIVQTFDVQSWTTLKAGLVRIVLGYKLFLACHIHASVFPASLECKRNSLMRLRWITNTITGRTASLLSEKCYPISSDAADIAIRFFGMEAHKSSVCSLGVDCNLFRPPVDEASQVVRGRIRKTLGFSECDIVCVYSGRFSRDKNPLCLAQAVAILNKQGMPFRGLFIGGGLQAEAIQSFPGSVVVGFLPFAELPPFYWAADIGVWPKQESTSQLDAAACGLPLVLSKYVEVHERVSQNGLTYEEDDPHDLARQLTALSDRDVRCRMGEAGATKVRQNFSWVAIAKQRIHDYETSRQRSVSCSCL